MLWLRLMVVDFSILGLRQQPPVRGSDLVIFATLASFVLNCLDFTVNYHFMHRHAKLKVQSNCYNLQKFVVGYHLNRLHLISLVVVLCSLYCFDFLTRQPVKVKVLNFDSVYLKHYSWYCCWCLYQWLRDKCPCCCWQSTVHCFLVYITTVHYVNLPGSS